MADEYDLCGQRAVRCVPPAGEEHILVDGLIMHGQTHSNARD
jgi:hypothetical protein